MCYRTSFTKGDIINGNIFTLSLGLHHPRKDNLKGLTANQQETEFISVTDKTKKTPQFIPVKSMEYLLEMWEL